MDDKVELGCLTRSRFLKIAQLCNFAQAFNMQPDAAAGNLELDYFHSLVQQA